MDIEPVTIFKDKDESNYFLISAQSYNSDMYTCRLKLKFWNSSYLLA